MKWSAHVLGLLLQGYTPEQIVGSVNIPFVTLEYVANVQVNETYKAKKQKFQQVRYIHPKSPSMKAIHAYATQMGYEAFMVEYRETSSTILGRKLGVSDQHVRDYVKKYIKSRNHGPIFFEGHLTYVDKLVAEGKIERPIPEKKITDILDLW